MVINFNLIKDNKFPIIYGLCHLQFGLPVYLQKWHSYQHTLLDMQTKPNQYYFHESALTDKNFVYILLKTLKSGFLYIILCAC